MSDDEQPGAVMGVTSGVKTMADDTLRISFDVEPRFAQLAFQLFGTRGTPVAIARLLKSAAIEQDRQETERNVGGQLARLAGQFCNAEPFQSWLRKTYDPKPRTPAEAAEIIRLVCKVASRADLDHDEAAASIFHLQFRLPYNEWLKGGMQ
jgi:hypothetical protein